MLNAGAVLSINEWKKMVRLQKEERRQAYAPLFLHPLPLASDSYEHHEHFHAVAVRFSVTHEDECSRRAPLQD